MRTRRAQGGKQEWLLLKHRGDAWAGPGRTVPEESVLSGRLLEDVAAGTDRQARAVAEARRLGAKPRALARGGPPPDAGGAGRRAFSIAGWLFELKYDGYRLVAVREGTPSLASARRTGPPSLPLRRTGARGSSTGAATTRRRSSPRW